MHTARTADRPSRSVRWSTCRAGGLPTESRPERSAPPRTGPVPVRRTLRCALVAPFLYRVPLARVEREVKAATEYLPRPPVARILPPPALGVSAHRRLAVVRPLYERGLPRSSRSPAVQELQVSTARSRKPRAFRKDARRGRTELDPRVRRRRVAQSQSRGAGRPLDQRGIRWGGG